MQVHLTHKSTNRKTGPIPVSTTSEDTCPTSCPWRGKGCYANGGPLRIHWRKVSLEDRGTGFSIFLEHIRSLPPGSLWRHNQAGDLPGQQEIIDHRKLRSLALASSHVKGFTYTHKPVLGRGRTAIRNRVAIERYNTLGFTINLSGDSPEHADQLLKLGIAPVTTVLPSDFEGRSFVTPEGNKGIVCPAAVRDGITCSSCKLCANYRRTYIIGFPAHGAQKGTIDRNIRMP